MKRSTMETVSAITIGAVVAAALVTVGMLRAAGRSTTTTTDDVDGDDVVVVYCCHVNADCADVPGEQAWWCDTEHGHCAGHPNDDNDDNDEGERR